MVELFMSLVTTGDKLLRDSSDIQKLFKQKATMEPFWKTVKSIVWRSTGKKFRSRGEGKWAELSAMTIGLRSHGGSAILQDSGNLLTSVTSAGKGSFAEISASSMTMGTNLKSRSGVSYPAVLQYGSKNIRFFGRGMITLPPRPFLYVDEGMRKDIEKAQAAYVQSLIKKGLISGGK